jgi:hypothetical protein
MNSIRYQEQDSRHAALLPLAAIVLQGGGHFVGIQAAVPECKIEAHVLFLAPSGTSLMLPLSELTAAAVFQKILESSARFRTAWQRSAARLAPREGR